ncbi:MAG: hypothetical protein WBK95_06660 [Sulfurimonas sp.]|nr:hypothetical protein [Sulfurimonas sp.]MDD3060181.1 hypothetical protein [Sulfurimonas sp.]MDD5202290.1 hypothetical protein [Sulfurimonas sp.]
MDKSTQHSFSSVISINPYNNTYFSGMSNILDEAFTPSYVQNQFVISFLNTHSFINAKIEISKNIPQEDLTDAIFNKVYDELALDQAVEYQIQFIETFNTLDLENRYFNVFIVDPLIITQTYQDAIDKLKYIDIIIPSPLLLKSLYTKNLIQNNGVHCFIYIQENDAFVTIYHDKEFVYAKSIKFSLKQMHERFCELYGERVEYQDFINFISTQSLKETQSSYKSFVIKLYKELFVNINDILTYLKRAFDLEKIEHLYIGMKIPSLTKLDEMIESELNIKASDFAFDYGFQSNSEHIEQMHALMHVYATLSPHERYESNFSTFHRPPKFIKRESGKLIMAVAASFAIAFAYPITYWVLSYAQELQLNLLQQEYVDVHNIKISRETTIKNKEADKEKALALLKKEKDEYTDKKNTLIKIHDVKVNYPMKAQLISTLTKDLNDYDVQLETLNYNEKESIKTLTLNLVAEDDKKITKLVEHLTNMHQGVFKFSLNYISYKDDTKKYFSALKVELL